jgi:hypothetical protein
MNTDALADVLRDMTLQDMRDFVRNHSDKVPLENEVVLRIVRNLMPDVKLPDRITPEVRAQAVDRIIQGIDIEEEKDAKTQRHLPVDEQGIMGMVKEGMKNV